MNETLLRQAWEGFLGAGRLRGVGEVYFRSQPPSSGMSAQAREGVRRALDVRGCVGLPMLSSLSHHQTDHEAWLAAVGYAPHRSDATLDVAGVGIDLEPRDRPTHERLRGKLVTAAEVAVVASLGALELWVIKEALFKSNPENEGTVVSQYLIRTFDPASTVGTAALPGSTGAALEARFLLLTDSQWLVGLAYTARRSL